LLEYGKKKEKGGTNKKPGGLNWIKGTENYWEGTWDGKKTGKEIWVYLEAGEGTGGSIFPHPPPPDPAVRERTNNSNDKG